MINQNNIYVIFLISSWIWVILTAHRTSMFRMWQQGGLILQYKIKVLVYMQLVNMSRQQFLIKSFGWKKCGNLFYISLSFSGRLSDFLKLLLIYASIHMFFPLLQILFCFAVNPHPALWFSIWETIWNNHGSILNRLLPLQVKFSVWWLVWPA